MNESVPGSQPAQVQVHMDERLSGAYGRILRLAIALSVAATVVATLLVGWRSGLGSAIGSLISYLNVVWLHQGTERLVQHMLAPVKSGGPSKFRLALPFPGRYLLVLTAVCVILKSYPRLLVGFIVGLALPIIASMGEGVYEALVISKTDQASN